MNPFGLTGSNLSATAIVAIMLFNATCIAAFWVAVYILLPHVCALLDRITS